MELSSESLCVDNTFGPVVSGGCRGGFDFTLLFEEGILSIPLSILLLLCFPIHLAQLLRKPRVTKKGGLFSLKVVRPFNMALLSLRLT